MKDTTVYAMVGASAIAAGFAYYYFINTPSITIAQHMNGTKTAADGFNNPGNLRYGGIKNVAYAGEVSNGGAAFKWFSDMPHGYRAIIKLYRYYYTYLGLTTLQACINEYAPPSDNNPTSSYVVNVSLATGTAATEDIHNLLFTSDGAVDLVKAVTKEEQGSSFVVNENDIIAGYNLL